MYNECEFCKHWEPGDGIDEDDSLGICNNHESPFYDRVMASGETCPGFTEI